MRKIWGRKVKVEYMVSEREACSLETYATLWLT
jgi:hypothetical protein